ncbi:MAG: nucleotidyltransferase domain-containing protein [Leptolyngbyaceae cyanobacterium]
MEFSQIPQPFAVEIQQRLAQTEVEHDVKILYACESGSRAWGFASPDSDYDVRFIYAHPADWYLSFDVERRRDVIEYPIVDEIDCNGWDLRKALYLFTRTNGALLEWLNSPIRYIEVGDCAEQLRALAEVTANSVALGYHYSHMARGQSAKILHRDQVRLKKYFYVLRPLLAIRHLEQGLGVPPVEFRRLVDKTAPKSLVPLIEELLALKIQSPELGLGKPVPELNEFIEHELDRHSDEYDGLGRPDLVDKSAVLERLNEIFRKAVCEVPGDEKFFRSLSI